jgi:hypothetical protein
VEVGGAGDRWSAEAAKKQVGQSRLQVSDEQWQLQVEVGGTGGRWSAKAAKKQVGQSQLQVTAVTVPGRDRKTVAKKGDDPGQMSSGRCKWRLEVRLVGAQSGGGGSSQKKNAMVLSFKTRDASHGKRSQEAEAGREETKKKNAMVLSFKTRDARHEKRSQEAEAGREEGSRQQQ